MLAPDSIPKQTLLLHALALILIQGSFTALQFTLPIVVRKHLDGGKWEVTLITAAPLVLAVASILWHGLQARWSLRRSVTIYWAVACAPLLAMAAVMWAPNLSDSARYWAMASCWILCSLGTAGWAPIAGEMLRRLYPTKSRGFVYGILTMAWMGAGAAASASVGQTLSTSVKYLPAILLTACSFQALGCILLASIGRRGPITSPLNVPANSATISAANAESVITDPSAPSTDPAKSFAQSLRDFLAPILHAGEILRSDRVFARYEAAFMTYGIGWMICYALVPLLITDQLKLSYDDAAENSHVVFLLINLLATVPAGLLTDRLGPARVCTAAFFVYALYPIALIFVATKLHLASASIVYGLAAAAVNAGWMLGPVALAPTAEKASHYVAIHTTMVGFRGGVFMFLGTGLYALTGSFIAPLAIAAAGFLFAAIQMWNLESAMTARMKK